MEQFPELIEFRSLRRESSEASDSSFSKDAQEYVSRIDSKIVLIDGEALGQLMIDHNVRVSPVAAYEAKKLDSDYFTEA